MPASEAVKLTLEGLVDRLLDPPPLLGAPGTIHSYSNTGFAIAGRVAEKLMGRPWVDAIVEGVCAPLGLKTAFADPKNPKGKKIARGHMPDPENEGAQKIVEDEPLMCMAPAGSTLAMSAKDLARFVKRRAKLLTRKSREEMETPQMELPPFAARHTTHWGLGWSFVDYPGHLILAHDGTTPGQAAFLRVFPKRDVAIVLLTNCMGLGLWDEIFPILMKEVAGVELPDMPPAQEGLAVTPARYVGHYGALPGGVRIAAGAGDTLAMDLINGEDGKTLFTASLTPYALDVFEMIAPGYPPLGYVTFTGEGEGGRAAYISWALRVMPRRDEVEASA